MATKKADEAAVESDELTRGPIDIGHLVKPFPPEALMTRKGGGGKDFTYIDFSAVVNRLNDATKYQWSFRILREEFVADVLMVTGELTIPTLGTRAAVGVQKYAQNSGEDLLKGGASDCLKKCASLFGVGLFTCDDRYEEHTAPTAQQAAPKPPAAPPAQAPAPPAPPANGTPDPATVPMTSATRERIMAYAIDHEIPPSGVDTKARELHGLSSIDKCSEAQARAVAAALKREVEARDPFAATPDATPKLKK